MLIYADLSQLEYRLIAHETKEMSLIKAFNNGEDIHTLLFIDIFGRKPKNENERKIAKTARYAEVYSSGFSTFLYLLRLSGVDISEKEGREIWYKVKGRFPAIDDYKDRLLSYLDGGGRIKNIFGRERYFHPRYFKSEYDAIGKSNMLREAFNWIFQSSGHDITEFWAMECIDLINDKEVLFVNEVHDEVVFDCPNNKVKGVMECIKFVSENLNTLLEQAFGVKLKVKIEAKVESSRCWK